ncbi:GntR family transcriptional regulator [Castellaniella sp.]|uniref:GntR family transcriptional regulator n=1 Tax=Castellaniella sp. TaxID=1955812 RepID=UPI003C745C98
MMIEDETHDEDADDAAAPLGNRVYDHLKHAVLMQQMPPGTLLQESELGQRFNVSRTPVREALRILLSEGLIRRHGRFYQVTTITVREIRDIFEVRDALERTAVRLFIERAPNAALKGLQDIIERQAAALSAGDLASFISLDREFHLSIAEKAQNPLLFRQISSVHDKVMLIHGKGAETTPTWFDGVIAEHTRILNALHRRDSTVADGEMRYHLNSVVRLHLGLQQEPYGQAPPSLLREAL